MQAQLVIADHAIQGDIVKHQRCALEPGKRYCVRLGLAKSRIRQCVYIKPHQRRDSLWSGKVVVMWTDTHRTAVLKVEQLEEVTES